MAKQHIWFDRQQVAEDFLDFLFRPEPVFPLQANMAKGEGWDDDVVDNLSPPDKAATRLEQALPEGTEAYETELADWYALYAWEVLQGLGTEVPQSLYGPDLEALTTLAQLWAGRLVDTLGRILKSWKLFQVVGEIVFSLLDQVPDKAMADRLASFMLSPEYIKEQARSRYSSALFNGDTTKAEEALQVLRASNRELREEGERAVANTDLVELWRQLKATLEEMWNSWVTLSQYIAEGHHEDVIKQFLRQLAWQIGLQLRHTLMTHPERARAILAAVQNSPEAHALTEQYNADYGWGGNCNRVIIILYDLTGPRAAGFPAKRQPAMQDIHKDQDEVELIGLLEGVQDYTRKKTAAEALAGAIGGVFIPYLRGARRHQRASYVRDENKARGIKVPPRWPQEGLTEDEIRKRIDADLEGLTGKVVPDYPVESQEGLPSSVLEQAEDHESMSRYEAEVREEERQAVLREKVNELCMKAGRLTLRQQFVIKNYNKDDDELALLLGEEFVKPFSPGAVRALKHDVVEKLRKAVKK